jgi:hypothetical protein
MVCGARHAVCGDPAAVRAIDIPLVREQRAMPVKRYKDDKGNVFSLSEEDAKKKGGMVPFDAEADAEQDGEPVDRNVEQANQNAMGEGEKAEKPVANKAMSKPVETKGR